MGWEFWIDRGGTFTDVVARRPDGRLITHKLLSEQPGRYADATIQGIRDVLDLPSTAPLPAEQIDVVKLGTTVATNALLERRGEPTLLLITRGFGDLLRIGHQTRPKIFARRIEQLPPLYDQAIEVDERVTVEGDVLRPLDVEGLRRDLQSAHDNGLRAVAIVFMHAYRHPGHERRAAQLARTVGFTQVSASHEVSPLIKIVDRGNTTVVDAYLSPIVRRHVDRLSGELAGTQLLFMQSNGGLVDGAHFQGRNSIVSGPAAGVVGAARTAEHAGFTRVIGFDMGGTSTDVSHYAGTFERTFDSEVAGRRLQVPMMQLQTVAAGGGSILHFDGRRFRVGPDSAGANPGPACYRRGGPLTITDCNVMVGKIAAAQFPSVFGPGGRDPIDVDVVRRGLDALTADVARAIGEPRTPLQVAHGFIEVAVANMAHAIRRISVERGYDVSEYTLCAFGGAGPQHACLVADALGMSRVFVHPYASVLSAYGLGLAERRAIREQSIRQPLGPAIVETLESVLARLEAQARSEIVRPGEETGEVISRLAVHVQYQGTDGSLEVDYGAVDAMAQAFEQRHEQRFGFTQPGRSLVVDAVSVEVVGASSHGDRFVGEAVVQECARRPDRDLTPLAPAQTRVYTVNAGRDGAGEVDARVLERDRLPVGIPVMGPALIVEPNSTVVVEPGWAARREAAGHLVLERVVPIAARTAMGVAVDPVRLEIFNGLFMSIADEMGTTLEKTAHSVNIKERRDFSCAVFDADGGLVANAPHIPVHLGSMGESVATVIRQRGGRMRPGDAFMLNAPYNGGTHLPDVTVITPVFSDDGRSVVMFVGSRGHHADIGGITPGSMPPDSRTIHDEGIVIDDVPLVEGGWFREDTVRHLLTVGPYPVRNIEQNLADLKAQLAANETGVRRLHALIARVGLDVVHAFMGHVQDYAEASVRRVLAALHDGRFSCAMDDGSVVTVAVTVDRTTERARVDFTGTSSQSAGNLNAPAAVCRAAVLYVFRMLVDEDIPLNGGCLRPIDIIIPRGSLLNPDPPGAVVAGNVETSQAIVDALVGALGVLAGSQGTMNNFTFGNDRWQYYETICGGSGAGPGFAGASAVQTHMTNSRITDPEVLESRFPVLLEAFSIRPGSGGAGEYRGGDGAIRRVRFRQAMTAAILSNRRAVSPFGLAGGEPGARGSNRVERADGSVETLPGSAQLEMEPGDVLVNETPGGGGWGRVLPPGRPVRAGADR